MIGSVVSLAADYTSHVVVQNTVIFMRILEKFNENFYGIRVFAHLKLLRLCGPWIFLIPRDFPCFADFFFENRDSLANLRNQIVEIPSISAGDLRDSRKFRDCGGRTGKKGVKISVISNAQTLYC